ncbi:MAG TPA: transglutaminase-like domain-containing protein [Cryomorphaceae bacterium]|nr:transglutaminase-like domain-containing protein [Cryomorphaceae bacterium]
MNAKEIDALINLIDDPDEDIYLRVREKIVSYGEDVIPQLENIWELNSFGVEFQQRIEDIIHIIQFDSVYNSLGRWAKDGGKNLFEGAMLIARYQYPDLDETEAKRELQKIRQDVWLEVNDELTALEKIKVFNHIIFDVHGFRGNKKNFHAAQNSYINTVLESKKGNPLSLSVLYIVIAESLDIPIYGVNLPNHFLLAYLDKYNIMRLIDGSFDPNDETNDVLFYVNAFSKGTIVHKSEITSYLEQLKLDKKPEFYLPCDNITILIRLLNNLIYSYDRLGYPEKVRELKRLHQSVAKHTDQSLS